MKEFKEVISPLNTTLIKVVTMENIIIDRMYLINSFIN